MIRQLTQYIADTVRRPRAELTRRQQQMRYSVELVTHCWRVLVRHRAEGMAAELTYRTIFSLIPLVVLGLVTFRVFGGLDQIEDRVAEQLYSFFGVPEVPESAYLRPDGDGSGVDGLIPALSAESAPLGEHQESAGSDREHVSSPGESSAGGNSKPSEGGEPSEGDIARTDGRAGAEPVADEAESLGAEDAVDVWDDETQRRQVQVGIRRALRELTAKVSTIDFASIGVFGLLLFIYAAIALADAVESVFNLIYSVPSGRPVHLRVAIHWSIITLGTGLLAMSLYMSGRLVDYIGTTTGWSIAAYANHVVALLSSWVLLFLLYALMPNTRVSVRAAAIGALVAAVLWEIAKFGFQVYVSKLVPYSALYGSIGLIPLFLFWVYVTWFIILFGLVWTYTLQNAPGHVPTKEEDESGGEVLSGDPDWLLLVMIEVAEAFERGELIGREELRRRLKLPTRIIQSLIDALQRGGLLLRIDSEKANRYVPARPADQIAAEEILRVGQFEPQTASVASWDVLKRLRDQANASLHGKTLAQLMAVSGD